MSKSHSTTSSGHPCGCRQPSDKITATPAVHAVKPLPPSLSEHDSSPNGCHEDCPACAEERNSAIALRTALNHLEDGDPVEAVKCLDYALSQPLSGKARKLAEQAKAEATNGSPTTAETLLETALEDADDQIPESIATRPPSCQRRAKADNPQKNIKP
jgi:hypothetical protein